MSAPALFIALALSVALVAGGAVAAFATANTLKRLAAVLMALAGAALVLASLGAPSIAVVAAIGVMFAYAVLGGAVAVRVQEAYGGVEGDELDSVDEQDEPREPRA